MAKPHKGSVRIEPIDPYKEVFAQTPKVSYSVGSDAILLKQNSKHFFDGRSASVIGGPTRAKKKFHVQSTVDPDVIREFVTKIRPFKHRQCCHFLRSLCDDSSLCQCGRTLTWHQQNKIPVDTDGGSDTTWTPAKDSRPIPGGPTTFGFIDFQGFGQKAAKSSPYIRLDYTTPHRDVWRLLSECWCLPKPNLIISVTGGAQNFVVKDKLKLSFKSGLVNAATTANAWIITGGTGVGVMEFVGEAVKEYVLATGVSGKEVVVLGIATWGAVDNKTTLIGVQDKGRFPAVYRPTSNQCIGKGVSLDHNTTHFLLVDDGTEGQFGREIEFRKDLEKYLSETCTLDSVASDEVGDFGENVPVVTLMLEGGPSAIKMVLESVKRNLPVVIIQGSGRAADLIAEAFRVKESQPKEAFDEFWKGLNQNVAVAFDWIGDLQKNDTRIKSCKSDIAKLLEFRHLIIVFALESCDARNGMEYAILKALLKANKSNVKTQLNLSLAWNRCDVAQEEIFNKENRTRLQNVDLSEVMLIALTQNQPGFVQLLLDNGVDLKQFLTVRRLRDLYHNVVLGRTGSESDQLLRYLLTHAQVGDAYAQSSSDVNLFGHTSSSLSILDESKPDPRLLEVVGNVVCSLLKDRQENFYMGPHFVVDENPATLAIRTSDYLTQGELRERGPSEFDYPERELFIWAVLLNRKELALLFWKAGLEQIGGALIACALLKSLSKSAEKQEELHLSMDITNHANEFEELAVGVLHECCMQDRDMAHKLLVRELKTWGRTTLLDIADSYEEMTFMEHTACQQLLNKIWRGRMALNTSFLKIVAAIFMPFMLLSIKFSLDGRPTEKQKMKKHSQLLDHVPLRNQASVQSSMLQVKLDDESDWRFGHVFYKVVAPCCALNKNTIGTANAAHYFHTSPVVKFCFHTISQVMYLGLFSYFVLCNLHPIEDKHVPSPAEVIVWIWTATLLLEEMRQFWTIEAKSLQYKLKGYLRSAWNLLDLLLHCLLVTSILLRFLLSGHSFFWARQCYAVTLSLNYIRFMQVFYIDKNIGPKVIMIKKMLTDLMFFLCILVVFLLAFGVSAHALRYPNSGHNWGLLKDVVYMPYWQMYGEFISVELEGDSLEGDRCSRNRTEWESNPDIERCPEPARLVTLLLALYLMLTNVLLLNLLIAMFSHTFQRVQANSEKVWRFNRYGLIREYFDRPALAPPFIIFSHCWRLLMSFINNPRESSDFKIVYARNDPEANQLSIFERAAMERYFFHQRTSQDDQITVQVTSANERIEEVMEELDAIKDRVGDQPRLFNSIWGSCKHFLNSSVQTLSGSYPLSQRYYQPQGQQTPPSGKIDGAVENRLKRLEEKMATKHQQVEEKLSNQEKKIDRVLHILQQHYSDKKK